LRFFGTKPDDAEHSLEMVNLGALLKLSGKARELVNREKEVEKKKKEGKRKQAPLATIRATYASQF